MSPLLRRRIVVRFGALLMAALTARLGWWQLDRAAQKRAMQARLDQRSQLPALTVQELALDKAAAEAQYERHARVRGRWLSDKTVFLDNRPMAGRVGFFVLTPLLLDDGTPLLVQRGWAPRNAAQRTELPALKTGPEPVELLGKLVPTPSRLYQFGAGKMWTWPISPRKPACRCGPWCCSSWPAQKAPTTACCATGRRRRSISTNTMATPSSGLR